MTVKIDRIIMLEATERHGALKRLVRECWVDGLNSADDWEALTDALDVADVPSYGDHLTDSTGNNAYDMVLVERNPTILDKGQAKIELIYESTFDMEQDLNDPRGGLALSETRCSVQQKSSNKNSDGDQVTVEHTYPADDPNHPGEKIVQGGEFVYFEAQSSIFLRGIKKTKSPWLITSSIIGRLNSVPWSGGAERTWMCTACSFRAGWSGGTSRLSNDNRYFMNFEFQYDETTWDKEVVFTDDVTGKAPANLIEDVGYKTVEKLREGDFDEIIGVLILGG